MKDMQSFILMQNTKKMVWIRGGEAFGALFLKKESNIWAILHVAVIF